MVKCANDEAVRELGIEWGIKQCRELIEHDVPVVHFYSMGKSNAIQRIAKEFF
jgi:methylenetetrahydrofolate reductase (NADPH)